MESCAIIIEMWEIRQTTPTLRMQRVGPRRIEEVEAEEEIEDFYSG